MHSSILAGIVIAAVSIAWASKASAGEDRIKLAVFGFELIDSSLQGDIEGQSADDLRRLSMIEEDLKRQLVESGRYELVDVGPAAEMIEAAGYLHGCNGCEAKIAEGLGADQVLIGWVQKVSNLILNLNVGIRDVTSRKKSVRRQRRHSWQY